MNDNLLDRCGRMAGGLRRHLPTEPFIARRISRFALVLVVGLFATGLLWSTGHTVWGQAGEQDGVARGTLAGPLDEVEPISPRTTTVFLTAVKDAYTASNRPGENYGGEENLYIGYQLSDGDRGALRTFIQFEFPGAIPTGSNINRARMRLYQRESVGLQDMRIVVKQPSGAWEEFDIRWGNQPGFIGDERASVFTNPDVGYKEWDITSLVQEWKQGSTLNHGIVLEGLEEIADNRRTFFSRNAGDPNLRPVLIVDYNPPGELQPPDSRFLHPMNPYQRTADFRVAWTANDPSGTGIAYYDVQFREPGQAWQDWQTRTVSTEAVFVGQHGRTYEFRVRAVNNANVAEPFGDEPQARTTLDLFPPMVAINPVPPFSNQNGVLVTWSGQDDVSGIRNYDVQIRYGNEAWVDAAIGTSQTSYFLPGREGVLAQMRVRAGDVAGNLSSYDAAGATVGFIQDTLPPQACLLRFVPTVLAEPVPFSVSWLATDGPVGSGVQAYWVEYRHNFGAWLPFESEVAFTSAVFTPAQGEGFYEFRVRAVDVLGNQGQFRALRADGSIFIGDDLPAPDYLVPLVTSTLTDDPFLAQCRRQP